MLCDLASFDSIRSFAEEFLAAYPVLDVLINNAGVVTVKRELTLDGYEMDFGVNHLGHFLLTNLLLGALKKAEQGRVVVVASGAYKIGKLYLEDHTLSRGSIRPRLTPAPSWPTFCSRVSWLPACRAPELRLMQSIRELSEQASE